MSVETNKFDDGDDELKQVVGAVSAAKGQGMHIPATRVLKWMKSGNIEVLGAVFSLLHDQKTYTQIAPPLVFADYHRFHLCYFERCLRENPDGEWSDSRYMAAHSLVSWFSGISKQSCASKAQLDECVSMLAAVYLTGDHETKEAVLLGALEHLFATPTLRAMFDHWKADPALNGVYREACELALSEFETKKGNDPTP